MKVSSTLKHFCLRGEEGWSTPIVTFMKENGKLDSFMVTEDFPGKMGLPIMEIMLKE